jgi:hypothetical protein
MSTAVHRNPNKLWRSNYIFNLCDYWSSNSHKLLQEFFFIFYRVTLGIAYGHIARLSLRVYLFSSAEKVGFLTIYVSIKKIGI